MFRVSSVSFENPSKRKIEAKQSETVAVKSSPISRNNLLPSHNLAAMSLVSFKGLDYYQTLNQNYFKLPEGAAPDEYQKKSAENLHKGNDVLVTAPTGTGKTAIAHYVITKNMEDGKRTFYTTPLKALSNEKFRQMKKVYGEENVGLLTGDVKVNPKAPIIVMTTEIYRNMVFGEKFKENPGSADNLEGLKTVIFDELHYLGDVDRGGVWEQSIILSDPKTQLLSLSATIGNNETINNWMSSVKNKPSILVDVPPEKRHVPLVFENLTVTASTSGSAGKTKGKKKTAPKADANAAPDKKSFQKVVDMLYQKDRLPAILFVFSKKASKNLLSSFAEDGTVLTSKKEREQIQEAIDKYRNQGKYLGESMNLEAMTKGYAIHNSGLLPAQKELVEELFQKKLVKVVIATETLSAGINMPARTTVISATRKPTSLGSADGEDGKRELSPNEFHQMAGRAGRRGIDTTGYVYTMSTNKQQKEKFDTLVNSKPNELKSSFNPDFSFVAGYYKMTKEDEVINTILKKSLYTYDKDSKLAKEKQEEMFATFEKQKDVLKDFGFIEEDNTLTKKGESLSLLNGYHQIPVIDTLNDKILAGLSPVELAAAVGVLANINEKPDPKAQKFKDNQESFQHDNEILTSYVDYMDKYLNKYNDKRVFEPKFKKVEQNKDVAKHMYAWADRNSTSPDSRNNWKELYSGELHSSIRDEGSLFKEVTQTIDLLKQLSTIADDAIEKADSESDKKYYSELNSTIAESLKLLRKEPIVDKD